MDWAFSNFASVVSKVALECPKASVMIYITNQMGGDFGVQLLLGGGQCVESVCVGKT